MSAKQIKICGFLEDASLRAALDASADFVGFVFFEKSPRNIAPNQAAELARLARGRAKIVALLVNPTLKDIEASIRAAQPDMLQLHGTETPEFLARVKDAFGLPLIKALGVRVPQDVHAHKAYAEVADWLLFDAKPAPGANRPGGNGRSFDWTALENFASDRPWLLSGGLAADNVAEAIRRVKPAGVDASSSLESAPGVKDAKRIQAFIQAVRQTSES